MEQLAIWFFQHTTYEVSAVCWDLSLVTRSEILNAE